MMSCKIPRKLWEIMLNRRIYRFFIKTLTQGISISLLVFFNAYPCKPEGKWKSDEVLDGISQIYKYKFHRHSTGLWDV